MSKSKLEWQKLNGPESWRRDWQHWSSSSARTLTNRHTAWPFVSTDNGDLSLPEMGWSLDEALQFLAQRWWVQKKSGQEETKMGERERKLWWLITVTSWTLSSDDVNWPDIISANSLLVNLNNQENAPQILSPDKLTVLSATRAKNFYRLYFCSGTFSHHLLPSPPGNVVLSCTVVVAAGI